MDSGGSLKIKKVASALSSPPLPQCPTSHKLKHPTLRLAKATARATLTASGGDSARNPLLPSPWEGKKGDFDEFVIASNLKIKCQSPPCWLLGRSGNSACISQGRMINNLLCTNGEMTTVTDRCGRGSRLPSASSKCWDIFIARLRCVSIPASGQSPRLQPPAWNSQLSKQLQQSGKALARVRQLEDSQSPNHYISIKKNPF